MWSNVTCSWKCVAAAWISTCTCDSQRCTIHQAGNRRWSHILYIYINNYHEFTKHICQNSYLCHGTWVAGGRLLVAILAHGGAVLGYAASYPCGLPHNSCTKKWGKWRGKIPTSATFSQNLSCKMHNGNFRLKRSLFFKTPRNIENFHQYRN